MHYICNVWCLQCGKMCFLAILCLLKKKNGYVVKNIGLQVSAVSCRRDSSFSPVRLESHEQETGVSWARDYGLTVVRLLETVEVRFEWYDCYPLFISYSLNVFAENVNISALSLVLSMQKCTKNVILYTKHCEFVHPNKILYNSNEVTPLPLPCRR